MASFDTGLRITVSVCILVVAVIHLLPVIGVSGQERLQALYGARIDSPDLLILMRHRAILFGLLGAVLVIAAFRTELQGFALIAGAVSIVSFLLIALTADSYGPQIQRVVLMDWVALVATAIGGMCWIVTRR
ncbi:MAG: phosphopantetheine adenylyltransferase [Gammaproteobacteria bacterium]|nr:phosphopantetheine adenylyltransferase [Gammaproteobacteria bacterium]